MRLLRWFDIGDRLRRPLRVSRRLLNRWLLDGLRLDGNRRPSGGSIGNRRRRRRGRCRRSSTFALWTFHAGKPTDCGRVFHGLCRQVRLAGRVGLRDRRGGLPRRCRFVLGWCLLSRGIRRHTGSGVRLTGWRRWNRRGRRVNAIRRSLHTRRLLGILGLNVALTFSRRRVRRSSGRSHLPSGGRTPREHFRARRGSLG